MSADHLSLLCRAIALLVVFLVHEALCTVTIQDFFSDFRNASDRFIEQRSVFTSQMTDLYYPEAIPCYCAGAGGHSDRFVLKGEAPEGFCTWSPYRWPGLFNQYLMEYIMLRKWNKSKDWKPRLAQMWWWCRVICITTCGNILTKDWGRVTKVCAQTDGLRSYWSKIVDKYYNPKEEKHRDRGALQLCVDTWNDRFQDVI